nr:tetratricopeptide repeat protein [Amylibacter sp.]
MKTANRAVALINRFLMGLGVIALGVQLAATSAAAQTESLDALFAELKVATADDWQAVEKKIWAQWSKSGSKAMDLLLERGKAEMEKGNYTEAVNHFSALIDHAPEFAEGWNARASAWFALERYGLSMVDIRQTLLLEPRHFGAMSGLATILMQLERPKDALKIYQQVQDIHPNRPEVQQGIQRLSDSVEGVEL